MEKPEASQTFCLKCSREPVFLDKLLDLVQTVWREQQVPKDWVDALLIPVPKKGDLSVCDNWRGISLLEVCGKEFYKIAYRGRTTGIPVRILQG